MLASPPLFAAIAVVVVGILILWSNPRRWVNRTVFTCSLHIALWLLTTYLATALRDVFWLKCSTSISALIPLHFWIVKEAIASELVELRRGMWKSFCIWGAVTVSLAIIPFTPYFIPAHSTAANRVYGSGYYVYIAGVLGLYLALGVDGFRRMRRLSGGQRLTLQVWLGGGCATAATVLLLMVANALTKDIRYIQLQPIAVLVYYAATTFAITTHRIFDARQLLVVGLEKIILVSVIAGAAWLLHSSTVAWMPQGLALLVTTAGCLWLAAFLNGWLDRWLRFYPQATNARQAAFLAARRETRIEDLEKAFINVLKGWGHAGKGLVMIGGRGSVSGSGLDLAEDSAVIRSIRHLRWATPERLARERMTPDRQELATFLQANELGALVIGEGPALSALIGVGIPVSRRPFTYPQMTQLLELASIMESALERAHFSVKAQHAEQLATVGLLGASLAHEIRNPLVSIKTFVHLLPKHHHDPVFRQKFFGLIGDEVTRIDRLTEQLLDLASPRVYKAEPMDLHPVLRTSLELVAAKATDKRIEFLTDFQANPDRAFTDGSAAKQVLLNLCFNAIQAVEGQLEGPRWVKVATRNVAKGIEMTVEDSGPGISPAIRPRLFQPFQSTKSSGFGLGLAICSDILAGLDATISVDPSVPGRGALFRIVFPCPT